MIKRWIKRIYAIEFLHCNVYNKIKAIPRKDCACIAQYDGKDASKTRKKSNKWSLRGVAQKQRGDNNENK